MITCNFCGIPYPTYAHIEECKEKPESKPQESLSGKLGDLLNEAGMQVTVTGWKAELIACEKERDALKKGLTEIEAILEKAKEELNIALVSASVEAKECDNLRKENAKLREALECALKAYDDASENDDAACSHPQRDALIKRARTALGGEG